MNEVMTPHQLSTLVKSSAIRNEKSHLTGFLMEREGYFMQLLEGEEDTVLTTFTRIEVDPRHDDVLILADAHSDARLLPDWHMAEIEWTEGMLHSEELLALFERSREALPFNQPGEILRLIERFCAAAHKK